MTACPPFRSVLFSQLGQIVLCKSERNAAARLRANRIFLQYGPTALRDGIHVCVD